MYTGMDIGYNAVKAVAGKRRAGFAAAVGTPDKARFALDGDSGIVLLSPQHVLIGDAAVNQSRFLHRREDRRWIESEEYLALFLAAVTELSTASVTLDLVTGLPVAFYDDKAALVERLSGEHTVQREGRARQRVKVNQVRVIPQPFGSLLAAVLDDAGGIADAGLARANVGVIDVGGKTCNILSVNRLSEVSRETSSVNVGGWSLVRAVRDWLSREYAGLEEMRDHALASAIQARELRYYGEPLKAFAGVVEELGAELAAQIISEAGQLWNGGATLDAILVTGGGALLLGQHIRAHWRHARVVADPVYANATGYYRLARRLFGNTQ